MILDNNERIRMINEFGQKKQSIRAQFDALKPRVIKLIETAEACEKNDLDISRFFEKIFTKGICFTRNEYEVSKTSANVLRRDQPQIELTLSSFFADIKGRKDGIFVLTNGILSDKKRKEVEEKNIAQFVSEFSAFEQNFYKFVDEKLETKEFGRN